MVQSLFKKHSKFQRFDEILYCGMNRFRDVKLLVFRKYQNTKTFSEKKNMGKNRFMKLSKFQKFQLYNFTLTWSNERKMNSVRFDMTYSKELQQKRKILTKLILKNIWIIQYCVMAISRNSNRFLIRTERSLSQKGIIKVYKNIPIQLYQVHKVLSL